MHDNALAAETCRLTVCANHNTPIKKMTSDSAQRIPPNAPTSAVEAEVDYVIFGGGIAGLWLLNKLVASGSNAILLENGTLGASQTLASQGIIHGGLKYALSGSLSTATNAIVEMPARWRDCLAGKSDVDLRGCKLLSEHYYMWSEATLRSKIKTFLGSKSLRGKITAVKREAMPDFFTDSEQPGTLYQLNDLVLDTASLLQTLIEPCKERIFSSADYTVSFAGRDTQGNTQNGNSDGSPTIEFKTVALTPNKTATKQEVSATIFIHCRQVIFCAGEGNGELLHKAGLQQSAMQTRPLKMAYVKSPTLPEVYCHCIGNDFRMNPRLTITSHRDASGSMVWYLGGDIAEQGVNVDKEEFLKSVRNTLLELFPHINLVDAQFNCFAINRAENQAEKNHRPDNPYVRSENGFLVCWPTKLTLTPALGDAVSSLLEDESHALSANAAFQPALGSAKTHTTLAEILPFAVQGKARWD